MDIFYALADPTRRQILEMLAQYGELPATKIYEQFPVSRPAISQHLQVLRQAESGAGGKTRSTTHLSN
ncbi:MAG: metalloregulator ArsR/SmtB family transcription factor [Anaerolineales bacterium]